jgi:hypothetical protein
VRDGVFVVDERGNAGVDQEIGLAVVGRLLVAIEDDIHFDAALMGIDQRGGDGFRSEGIGLHEDAFLSGVDFLDDCIGASALRRKKNFDRRQFFRQSLPPQRVVEIGRGKDEGDKEGEGDVFFHGSGDWAATLERGNEDFLVFGLVSTAATPERRGIAFPRWSVGTRIVILGLLPS